MDRAPWAEGPANAEAQRLSGSEPGLTMVRGGVGRALETAVRGGSHKGSVLMSPVILKVL